MIEILVYAYYMHNSVQYLNRIAKIFSNYNIPVCRDSNATLIIGDLKFIAYCEANHKQVETGRRNAYQIYGNIELTEKQTEEQIKSLLKSIHNEHWLKEE